MILQNSYQGLSAIPQFAGNFFQSARLSDIWLLGPFMVWYALQSEKMPDWARVALGVSGLLTIGFNLRNYVKVQDEKTN